MILKLTSLTIKLITTIVIILTLGLLFYFIGSKIIDGLKGNGLNEEQVEELMKYTKDAHSSEISQIEKNNDELLQTINSAHRKDIKTLMDNNRRLQRLRLRNIKNDNRVTWIIMIGIFLAFLMIISNTLRIIYNLPDEYIQTPKRFHINELKDGSFIIIKKDSEISLPPLDSYDLNDLLPKK